MYIFRNAMQNLWRNKGRNVLTGLLLLISLTMVTISLCIRYSSNRMLAEYQNSFKLTANISADWEKISAENPPEESTNSDGSTHMSSSFTMPTIPLDDYLKYAESSYVKGVGISASTGYASNGLCPVADNPGENEAVVSLAGMTVDELLKLLGLETRADLEAQFGAEQLDIILNAKREQLGNIYGYSDTSLISELNSGQRAIKEGRLFAALNECVISSKFAQTNNITLGDTLAVTGGQQGEDTPLELTVVGLFEDYQMNAYAPVIQAELNDILVSYDTLIGSGFCAVQANSVDYYLNDAESVDAFSQELQDKGLNELMMVESNASEYTGMVKPIQNLSKISLTFLMIVLLLGGAVLMLMSLFAIRERKYEIGVLRAIGMKKSRIAAGLLSESMVLVAVCLVFAFGIGTAVAQPLSDALLSSQKAAIEDASAQSDGVVIENVYENGVAVDGSDTQQIAEITVMVEPVVLLQITGIALLLGLLSALVGILNITKYEPIRILSERN